MKSRVKENIGKSALANAMAYKELPDGDREVTFNSWINDIIWFNLNNSYRSTRWVINKDNLWFLELKTAGGTIYKTGLHKDINGCIDEANEFIISK